MSDHGGHDDDDDDDEPHGHAHHDEHESGHGEPWLMSYADMMTLLFGFFVLLYSFEAAKNSDAQSMVRMRKELSQFFGGTYVNPLTQVAEKYQQELKGVPGLKDVTFRSTPEGLEITFQSTVLFQIGQADLAPQAAPLMDPLIKLIKESKTRVRIKVEGYTDDNPIHSDRFPSNWELSGSRASSVLRRFESSGFDSNYLTAVGFGSTRPAFPNRTPSGQPIPDNQSRNRRVVILVTDELEAAGAKKPTDEKLVEGDPPPAPPPAAEAEAHE